MAMNIFLPGLDTEEDVLAIRSAIITGNFTTTGGLTCTSWTSEGTSMTKQWAISPMKLLEECNLFLQAVNSGSYGKRITRTRPAYNLYSSTI